MSKKYIFISLVIIVLIGGLVFISFSPNTKKSRKKIDMTQVQNEADTQLTNSKKGPPPPPPKKKKIGKIAPPPPPPPKTKGKIIKKPEGYKNFFVKNRPQPIHMLAKGETKDLQLEVIKGSEDFIIKWFKKEERKLTQVGVGDSFTVSASKKTAYYVAVIDDNIDRPQQIFFEISPSENSEDENQKITDAAQNVATGNSDKINTNIDLPQVDELKNKAQEIKDTKTNKVKEKAEDIAAIEKTKDVVAEVKEEIVKTEVAETPITATSDLNVTLPIGSPINLSYTTQINSPYKVFWYHRPLGKKKSALIKGKKTLSFSLKKLNKYHPGEFYIQIRDKSGKVKKSPEYKVRIKK